MPIYDYKCLNCSHKFTKLQPKVTEAPVKCRMCGKLAIVMPSVPAPFQWGKAGGWK